MSCGRERVAAKRPVFVWGELFSEQTHLYGALKIERLEQDVVCLFPNA